jgi:integrase
MTTVHHSRNPFNRCGCSDGYFQSYLAYLSGPDNKQELLAVPDRSTLKGKRDYAILALLAELDVATIQQREGRWVLANLEGKGRRIRTVAIPIWVIQGINAWMIAAGIEDGRLLRSVSKSGKVNGDTLSDWAVWSVVEQSSKQIGIEHFGRPRSPPYLRQALPEEWRGSGADQIPAWAFLNPDD